MSNGWLLILSGIVFCGAGLFLFQRNAFEEHRKVWMPLLVIAAGILLIGIGTARRLHLIE